MPAEWATGEDIHEDIRLPAEELHRLTVLYPGRAPTADEWRDLNRAHEMGVAELKLTYVLRGYSHYYAEKRAREEQNTYTDGVWRDRMKAEGRNVE